MLGEPRFERYPQAIGDPVDVGVVGGHLTDVEDVAIAEPRLGQRPDICLRHSPGVEGELLGIGQHRLPARIEVCLPPSALYRIGQGIVFEQAAQTAPMVHCSVVALVGEADDQSHHLPVHLAKRAGALHRRSVQGVMGGEGLGVQRVDLHDVVHSLVLGINYQRKQISEFALPAVFSLRPNPGHAPFWPVFPPKGPNALTLPPGAFMAGQADPRNIGPGLPLSAYFL